MKKRNKKIIYGDRSQKDIPVQVYLSFDFPPWIGNQYYENIFFTKNRHYPYRIAPIKTLIFILF